MSTSSWRVGILGAGRIAQGFDKPEDSAVLTMAHALRHVSDFELGGFFDIHLKQTEEAERKWNIRPSPRERTEWLQQRWDILYIATPDAFHVQDLSDALDAGPKAIIVEKPLGTKIQPGLALLEKAAAKKIPVLVNFPRRWHSGVIAAAQALESGKFGEPRTGQFICSGGIAHNGVHLLDLFATLFGTKWHCTTSTAGSRQRQLVLTQGTQSFELSLTHAPADYFIFEMHIQCSNGKVDLMGSPETLSLSSVQPSPLYAGFRVCRTIETYEMGSEPLLTQALKFVKELLENAEMAKNHANREIQHLQFIGGILEELGAGI